MKKVFIMLIMLLPVKAMAQAAYVSSRNSNSVKKFNILDGSYLGDFVMPSGGGLSLPQEVLWHPSGFLLVTGRGNTAIKKYDGGTGSYLGDFTTGYMLDNPTKTTIGPDSLVYVSQWGASQNKVARFDLYTGNFVDEFTSNGLANGGGHAWDTAGNLYVAQFGDGQNGTVAKYDQAGNFQSIFINSTQLQGPINLWFDSTGTLMVVDWTLGSVLKFDGSSGAYIGTLVSGLMNAEGFAFDEDGYLYLCDWTANAVYRYDIPMSWLTPAIQAGGLAAPNSIIIRHDPSLSVAGYAPGDNSHLIYLAPSGNTLTILAGSVSGYRVLSVSGQEVLSGKLYGSANALIDISGLCSGTYIILLQTEEGVKHLKFTR